MQRKNKILVVDDVQINRIILSELFEDEYEIIEADNGQAAWELISQYRDELSIVLLDIVMPIMNGLEVLQKMNESGLIETVPVILVTGENSDERALSSYSLGVSDLINKPFNPEIIKRRVSNVVRLYSHKQELVHRLEEQRIQLEEQAEHLRQANLFVIDALSAAVEFRSMESGEHTKRVRLLVKALLNEVKRDYELTEPQIEAISNASTLHDIGKIAIPDSILLKPGRLTDEEFEIMKKHTIYGCDIIASLNYTQDKDYYTYCYNICRYHHERWDGRGYPDGLVGDQIPVYAQATGIADVYDALTSDRVYKAAYSHEEALEMIYNGQCGVFNPFMLDALRRVSGTFQEMLTNGIAAEYITAPKS